MKRDWLTWLRSRGCVFLDWARELCGTFRDWFGREWQDFRRTPSRLKLHLVRPTLEVLEARIVPANSVDVFTGGTKAAPVSWFSAANWSLAAPPDSQDMAVIGDTTAGLPGFVAIPSGSTADAAGVLVTGTGGSTLTVAPNAELVTDPNGNTAGFTGAVSSASGGALF